MLKNLIGFISQESAVANGGETFTVEDVLPRPKTYTSVNKWDRRRGRIAIGKGVKEWRDNQLLLHKLLFGLVSLGFIEERYNGKGSRIQFRLHPGTFKFLKKRDRVVDKQNAEPSENT